MDDERLQNLLGALAVAVSDRLVEAIEPLTPRNEPASAIALIGRSPGRTIRALSEDVHLSPAATLRLVGHLVDDGLVERAGSTSDRRAVRPTLTESGERAYRDILSARRGTLAPLLSSLSNPERRALGTSLEKLLIATVGSGADASAMYRLCDVAVCRTCPIDRWRDDGDHAGGTP